MTATTGYDAYLLYSGLKLHFDGKYDFFKYHGKLKLTRENFERSKSKFQFYKLSRKYDVSDLRDYYVSNFLVNNSAWVGELLTAEGEERYKTWKKRIQSLTYMFKADILHMLHIFSDLDHMLKVTDGQHPPLFREMLMGKVSFETVVILNDILNFFPMWTKKIDDDLIWPSWEHKLLKYTPFVEYDKKKFVSLLKELVNEHAEA